MRHLTLNNIANLLNVTAAIPPHNTSQIITGYAVDSRKILPGQLFFALPGQRVNGHAFLREVKNKGAIGAVVSKETLPTDLDLPCIVVNDPLAALQKIASQLIINSQQRVVGVTGSVGKTTTKTFIYELLSPSYRIAVSSGNSNSQIGLPLTILNDSSAQDELLVLEMGMTEPSHILQLVAIAPPEVALITTVALVHAANFETLDEISKAKSEIFSHPRTKIGILPHNLANYDYVYNVGNCQKRSFAIDTLAADYQLKLLNNQLWFKNSSGHLIGPFAKWQINGSHHLQNLLAALAVADYFNVPKEILENVIPKLNLTKGRGQIIQHEMALFIDDSYNASEISTKAALVAMPTPQTTGRKIAVLGSMLELGSFSFSCHQNVAATALENVDILYCLGSDCQPMYELWKTKGKPVYWFDQRDSLINALRQDLKKADVVLLKGSNSHMLWKVLEEL